MKVSRFIPLLSVVVVIGGLIYIFQQRQQLPPVQSGSVRVVASFYPLAEFARQVGGNLVEVTTVVPADSEPHEYEPTPQELTQAYDAAVFIYNGSGVDPWAERIAPQLAEKGVRVINMSDIVPLLPADPHFWLDPVLVQKQVEVIRDALIAADPAHATAYRSQSEAYSAKLANLDQDFRQGLATCARRDIVTSHAAFGYLAKQYNLSVITITGISPEEEPSARALSEIAQLAREKNIRYIFFETLASPKLAQTVASEIGAQTLVFNPLEGVTDEERQAGKDYLSLMRDNLQNLRVALECR